MTPAVRTTISQDDFSAGMVRDIAQELIPANGAYDLVNALLDEDGNPYRRGGTAYKSGVLPDTAGILDNANRADEEPISQGGKWDGVLVEESPPLAVVSNQISAPSLVGSAVYDKTVTNGSVYATMTTTAGTFQFWIRSADEDTANLRGYFVKVTQLKGIWTWSLWRLDPGKANPQMLGQSAVKKVTNGDSIALMAIGDEISAWHKDEGGQWDRVVVAKDSTYASGRLALLTFGGSFDDFGGGDITPFATSGLTWCWDGYLFPGQRTLYASGSDFGTLAADDRNMVNLGGAGLSRPKQSAVLEDLLFIGGGAIYGGSRKATAYSTGTITVTNGNKAVTGSGTAFLANVDVGMLLHIGSERVYVVAAVNSNTELTLRDKYEGTGGGGKAYALSPLYTVGSDPYESWDYLTVCENRLVVMNGRTIKTTEIDNPHTFTNSLGTTNEHTLPEGAEGIGLATVAGTALVFTTAGIWTLDGLALDQVDQNGNTQHRLQQLSEGSVLAGATGIAGVGQQLVIPCEDGIYLMDGISQPVRISRPVEALYRSRIAAGYSLGRAVVFRGHYLLPIITSSAAVKTLLVCRLDRPTRARHQTSFPWSRFTGDGGEIPAYAVRSSLVAAEPVLLGAQARPPSQVVDCSAYFEPDAEHEVDADGSVHDLELTSRDIQTGSGTINRVRSFKPRYELKGDGASKVQAYYSLGSSRVGAAKFGHAKFGHAKFGGEGGATFVPIGEAGESNGRDPARFPVNKKMRFARMRVKSSGRAAICALREFELTIRPSGAVRR